MRRHLVPVLGLLAIFSGACGSGDDGEKLDEWAVAVCTIATQFYDVDAAAFANAGAEFAGTQGGDQAVRRYAEVVREAAEGGRTFVAGLEALEPPSDDVRPFYEAQIATGALFAELMDEFAGTMEEYLETGDLATLGSAYPTFIEKAEAGSAAFADDLDSLPVDAKQAFIAVPDCGILGGG